MAEKHEVVVEESEEFVIECHKVVLLPASRWVDILNALPDELAAELAECSFQRKDSAVVPRPIWLTLMTFAYALEARH
jgi:hypothetical protein